jgi:hypothetical protein
MSFGKMSFGETWFGEPVGPQVVGTT